jgi:CSLREA domain-containing protein
VKTIRYLIGVLGVLFGTLAAPVPVFSQTTFVVDTEVDAVDSDPGDGICETAAGDCSLRAAVQETNALAGEDVIEAPAGEYVLSIAGAGEDAAVTGDLDVTDDLTIEGAGAANGVIDGDQLDRVLDVLSETALSMSGFTISDSSVRTSGAWPPPNLHEACGGAIRNRGSLAMSHFVVSNGHIFFGVGGGICNFGSLTLADGQVIGNSSVPDGGGIWSVGNLSLVAVTVTGNQAEFNGGGIHSEGTLTITDSTISENLTTYVGGGISIRSGTADLTRARVLANKTLYQGAGIFNSGDMDIADSTISGNQVDNIRPEFPTGGGGIYNAGVLSISRTTVSRNAVAQIEGTALFAGGGISNGWPGTAEGTAQLTNTTISGNSASVGGGLHYGEGALTGSNLTISNNVAASAGGVYSTGDLRPTLANTVIANNTGANCSGEVTSLGHNLDSDGTCGPAKLGDIQNGDPLLGPLTDNGGPTETHSLLEGSPAIDAGSLLAPGSGGGACEARDQRGIGRPRGNACDIGAYESDFTQTPPTPGPTGTPAGVPRGGGALSRGATPYQAVASTATGIAFLALAAGLAGRAFRRRFHD